MGKRVLCLICATVLVVAALFSVRTWSDDWDTPTQVQNALRSVYLSKAMVKRSPNPLASSMFLILAGLGISMLFDKKNKH